jgi:hypothetical protein
MGASLLDDSRRIGFQVPSVVPIAGDDALEPRPGPVQQCSGPDRHFPCRSYHYDPRRGRYLARGDEVSIGPG